MEFTVLSEKRAKEIEPIIQKVKLLLDAYLAGAVTKYELIHTIADLILPEQKSRE